MVKTPGGMLFVRNFFESVAFYIIFEYTKNEQWLVGHHGQNMMNVYV